MNKPAESEHPSLRIAHFSAVSRHDVPREANELQAVCTGPGFLFRQAVFPHPANQ
jgi:hypothetical protein